MAEAKTRPTTTSFESYLGGIVDPERRTDCEVVADLMGLATGQPPVIWGPAIVGFGSYMLTYAKGAPATWPIVAFASRKIDMSLYIGARAFPDVLATLGKFKMGGGCLYIKRLSDVDIPTLAVLIAQGVESMSDQRIA